MNEFYEMLMLAGWGVVILLVGLLYHNTMKRMDTQDDNFSDLDSKLDKVSSQLLQQQNACMNKFAPAEDTKAALSEIRDTLIQHSTVLASMQTTQQSHAARLDSHSKQLDTIKMRGNNREL